MDQGFWALKRVKFTDYLIDKGYKMCHTMIVLLDKTKYCLARQ
jgi:hypothetical protein